VTVRLILCLSLALAAGAAWTADVYMAVAPDGTVIYSDRPTAPDAKPVDIAITPPSSPPSPIAARPGTAPEQSEPSAEDLGAASEPELTAEQRAQNCEIARERVARYANARRLFRQRPDGEREYLSDEEIDEVRARAAADVERWCS